MLILLSPIAAYQVLLCGLHGERTQCTSPTGAPAAPMAFELLLLDMERRVGSMLQDGLVKHLQKRPHTMLKSTRASLSSPIIESMLFLSFSKQKYVHIC